MNKTDSLISVIVPIYSVEKYLDKCVSSITTQNYKNLEIILVDDGSPDKSPDICDAWAQKDARIKVIHKKNGGLSSARNAGLKVATGSFISFVDSDDYLEPDLYKSLIVAFDDCCVDMVGYGIKVIENNVYVGQKKIAEGIIEVHEAIKHLLLLDGCIRSYAWNKIFRASVVHGIYFDEELKYGEDTPFVFQVLCNCKKIYQTNVPYYNYIIRSESLTGESFNVKKLGAIHAASDVLSICETDYPQYSDYAKCMLGLQSSLMLNNLMKQRRNLKKYKKEYVYMRKVIKECPIDLIYKNLGAKKATKWFFQKHFTLLYGTIRRYNYI